MVPRPVRNVVKAMVRSSGDQTGIGVERGIERESRRDAGGDLHDPDVGVARVRVDALHGRTRSARRQHDLLEVRGRADDAGVTAIERHPCELAAAAAARAIDERALVGDREGAAGNLLCNRHRRSETLERRGIEALRHERLLSVEEQVVRRRERRRAHRGEHVARGPAVDRRRVDPRPLAGCAVEKMTPVRQEVKDPVARFTSVPVQCRHGPRWTAGVGDRVNRAIRPGHEEDRALRAPRAAAHAVGIAQHGDGTAAHVYLLELAAGDEGNRVAVRRPERKRRAFGVGERRDGAVDGSHPELTPAFGSRRERQALPVRRDDGPVGPVEPEPFRERDVEACPLLRTLGPMRPDHHGDGGGEHGEQRRSKAVPPELRRGSGPCHRGSVQALVEHALQAEDDVLRGLPAQLGRLREARANQVVEAGRRRDTLRRTAWEAPTRGSSR